jgi:hypothetical protein
MDSIASGKKTILFGDMSRFYVRKVGQPWGFEDQIGERLIDVSVKRRKYIGYHNRHVFKK